MPEWSSTPTSSLPSVKNIAVDKMTPKLVSVTLAFVLQLLKAVLFFLQGLHQLFQAVRKLPLADGLQQVGVHPVLQRSVDIFKMAVAAEYDIFQIQMLLVAPFKSLNHVLSRCFSH